MKHRHLIVADGTPVERLPSAAIVDLLERGDLGDWAPIAKAIRRDPFGELAERVLRLVSEFPMYGTSALWRAFIARRRLLTEGMAEAAAPATLADLRKRARLTQRVVAERAGMTQSDLSKLERRTDVHLSSLRVYAAALGGRVDVVYVDPTTRASVLVGKSDAGPAVAPSGARRRSSTRR